jgi:hypothetical protein
MGKAQGACVRVRAPHSYGMLQWASLHDLRHRTKRHIVKDPMMSDANKYHRQAEECRRNSESALRPIDREAWLRLAADYAKLAEGAELTQRLQDISRRSSDTRNASRPR